MQVPHFREAEPQLALKLEGLLREFSEGRAGALPQEPAVGDADGPTLLGTETDGAPTSEPGPPASTTSAKAAPEERPAPLPVEAVSSGPQVSWDTREREREHTSSLPLFFSLSLCRS